MFQAAVTQAGDNLGWEGGEVRTPVFLKGHGWALRGSHLTLQPGSCGSRHSGASEWG